MLVGHALVARDDHHLRPRSSSSTRYGRTSTMRAFDVRVVRDDPGLRAGEADRRHAACVERHRQERHRDALAGREQHVELAARRALGDLSGERQQLVRGLAHRGDDHHHVAAGRARGGHLVRDLLHPGDVGHRASTVLLDDDRRRFPPPPSSTLYLVRFCNQDPGALDARPGAVAAGVSPAPPSCCCPAGREPRASGFGPARQRVYQRRSAHAVIVDHRQPTGRAAAAGAAAEVATRGKDVSAPSTGTAASKRVARARCGHRARRAAD